VVKCPFHQHGGLGGNCGSALLSGNTPLPCCAATPSTSASALLTSPPASSLAGTWASTAWLPRHILKCKPVSAFGTGGLILQVLPSKAVTHLQLVEPQGEHLRTPRNRNVVLLPARHPVLFTGGLASCPLLWLYLSEQGGRRARLRYGHG